MKSPAASQLDALFPGSVFCKLTSETVEILPIGMAQTIRLRNLGVPIIEREFGNRSFETWILEEPEECNRLLSIATERPVEWCKSLSDDDRLTLAFTLIEANKDVFLQIRLPEIARGSRMIGEILLSLTPSNASANTDTATPDATPARKPNSTSPPSTAPSVAPGATA